ncbi:hypothetical protein ACVOMV_17305 [Mesorhizobium atlanticum]
MTSRREGSPFTGLSTIALKEAADHMNSIRIHLVMLLVLLTAVGSVYAAISQIKATIGEDQFLFLRLFTTAQQPLPSFVFFLGFLIPWWRSRSASTLSTANTPAARCRASCLSQSTVTRSSPANSWAGCWS